MITTMNHVIVYSGGMDSFTLLEWVRRNRLTFEDKQGRYEFRNRIHAVSFDYQQRHKRELFMARQVCDQLHIDRRVIGIQQLATFSNSNLVGPARPTDGDLDLLSQKATVVPGRNTVMLSLALAYAEGLNDGQGLSVIYYGAHAGSAYPDCQPEFIDAMAETIKLASAGRVRLETPFIIFTKKQILTWGLAHGLTAADYASTWSCYNGGDKPCQTCGACISRAEAFAFNQITDPLLG